MQKRTTSRRRRIRQARRVDALKLVTLAQLLFVCVLFSFSGMPFKAAALEPFSPTAAPTPNASPTPTPTPLPTPTPTLTPPWLHHIVNYKEDFTPWVMAWDYRPVALEAPPPGVDAMAPAWLFVEADEEGNPQVVDVTYYGTRYESFNPRQYVNRAHDDEVAVWITVQSFNPDLSEKIVMDEDTQAAFIDKVVGFCEDVGADGINFDFEKMDPANKTSFSALVANTKAAMGDEYVVSATVTVPLGYDAPKNWWQCYDRAGLAEACDYVVVMAYDTSTKASAPYDWVERRLQMTLEEVPSDKLIMGLPFYGSQYVYKAGNTERAKHDKKYNIFPSHLKDLLENGEFKQGDETFTLAEWHEKGRYVEDWEVYEYTFTDTAGNYHEIYMDDAQTIAKKGTLTQKYSLAGAAIWQARFGTEDLWAAMRAGVDTESEALQ